MRSGRDLARQRLWLWLALLVFGASVALKAVIPPQSAPPGVLVQEKSRLVDPATELLNANAVAVKAGLFIENLHSLSLRQRIFNAEGLYWLIWPQDIQRVMEAEEISPLQLVEITNQVNSSSTLIEPDTAAPVALSDGSFYQLFRFSTSLYISKIDLRRSPFQRLVLPVVLEIVPDAFSLSQKKVLLVADTGPGNSTIGADASINGFSIESTRYVSSLHSYGTTWGLNRGSLDYPRLSLEVVMRSDSFSSFVTWILPLLIVMLIVMLAPLLDGELGDLRLAIPSTALLTLIFLQQTYKAELPALNYLTFLDYLYAYSYIVSLVLFILFLWGNNVYSNANETSKPAAVLRIAGVDRLFQISSFVGFFVVGILAWMI